MQNFSKLQRLVAEIFTLEFHTPTDFLLGLLLVNVCGRFKRKTAQFSYVPFWCDVLCPIILRLDTSHIFQFGTLFNVAQIFRNPCWHEKLHNLISVSRYGMVCVNRSWNCTRKFITTSRIRVIFMYPVILSHYCDVIMNAIPSQITSVSIVYSSVCSDADQR